MNSDTGDGGPYAPLAPAVRTSPPRSESYAVEGEPSVQRIRRGSGATLFQLKNIVSPKQGSVFCLAGMGGTQKQTDHPDLVLIRFGTEFDPSWWLILWYQRGGPSDGW